MKKTLAIILVVAMIVSLVPMTAFAAVTAGAGGAVASNDVTNTNATATAVALPNTGYSFEGWYAGATLVSDVNILTVTWTNGNAASATILPGNLSGFGTDGGANIQARFRPTGEVLSNKILYIGDDIDRTAITANGILLVPVQNALGDWVVAVAPNATVVAPAWPNDLPAGANTHSDFQYFTSNHSVRGETKAASAHNALVLSAATYTFTMPNSDLAINAVFADVYEVVATAANGTVTLQPGGITGGKGCFTYRTAVTLTATPKAGYVFDKWLVNDDTNSKWAANGNVLKYSSLDQDLDVTALFKLVGIKVSVEPAAAATGYVQSADSLTAGSPAYVSYMDENPGYEFVGWKKMSDGLFVIDPLTGAKFLGRTLEVTVPPAGIYSEYVAVFKAKLIVNPISITVRPNNAELGTTRPVSGNSFVAEKGSAVALTATAADGYKFAGWYVNDVKVSSSANYTVHPTASTTYVAKFVPSSTVLEPDPINPVDNPKTGDTTNVIVWALLGIVALGALAVVAKKKIFVK